MPGGRLVDYAGPVWRRKRERAGITQAEIAERAGVSIATISRFESGGYYLAARTWDQVGDSYAVTLGESRLELFEAALVPWREDERGGTSRRRPVA
jgi:ribosome-binding protein aMBF1 (putative translation factor)